MMENSPSLYRNQSYNNNNNNSSSSSSSHEKLGKKERNLPFKYPSILLLFLLLFFPSVTFVSFKMGWRRRNRVGIVVLGGGLLKDGQVPPHVTLRLKKAVELYNAIKATSQDFPFIITLSGGTPHKPNPVDQDGFPYKESTSGALDLIAMGIPPDHILEEAFTLDTFGNAYWLRQIHILPTRINRMLVITNNWHMERTKALFDMVFQSWSIFESRINIEYIEVEAALEPDILAIRKEKEQQALATFKKQVKPKIKSLEDLHHYIFMEHLAYSTKRLLSTRKPIDPKLLETY
jgi:uncharacterized SAM-binding protein YcdF (DUF218 family)